MCVRTGIRIKMNITKYNKTKDNDWGFMVKLSSSFQNFNDTVLKLMMELAKTQFCMASHGQSLGCRDNHYIVSGYLPISVRLFQVLTNHNWSRPSSLSWYVTGPSLAKWAGIAIVPTAVSLVKKHCTFLPFFFFLHHSLSKKKKKQL